MKIITFPLVMGMLLLSSICEGKEYQPKSHKYTAKVSTIRLNSLLIDKGKKQDDVVEVNVASIILDPPLEIKDARKAPRHSIPEINTLVNYTVANIEGSVKDLISFWAPEERAEKEKLMDNPKIFNANRKYHKKNPGLNIVGIVYQKETSSILIERHGSVTGVTFRKSGNKYYLTDKPTDDLELAIIEASFNQSAFRLK